MKSTKLSNDLMNSSLLCAVNWLESI